MNFINITFTDPPQPLPPTGKHRRKEGLLQIGNKKSPLSRGVGFASVLLGSKGRGVFFKNLILLTLVIFPIVAVAQQPDSTQQLQKYLQIAAERNPAIRSTFYQYLAALQEAPQVGTLPDPTVAFGYFIAPVETRLGAQSARFSISQMFPWFGTLDARSDAAILQAKAEFAKFQDQRNWLFYSVKEKWYSLYILNRHIETVKENISILETFVEITLQEYRTGSGNQADVLQAQIELENLRVKKQELIDNRRVLIREFNELLHSNDIEPVPNIPSDLQPEELMMNRQQLLQRVLANNPKLNRLALREKAAKKSIEAARLSGYPKFGIGATYMFIDERPVTIPNNGQNAFMATISINIPLYRDKYEAKKKQAILQKKAVEYRQIAVVDNLITRVQEALRDYREASRNYALYSETQIQRTKQALDILLQKYATGNADFEEILELQRQILEYQLAKAKALGKQYIALALIQYLYGKYNIEPSEIDQ